ncbi:MAG: cytochrome c biogenesis protein CcsA, partial [Bdellovibrionales bacterium]|nr:cytochrome c biogenesis protein CcsA [Bdellovibrionales bacterium]
MRIALLLFLVLGGPIRAGGAFQPAEPPKHVWSSEKLLDGVSRIAIQSGGRVKPFETFAREGVELLTGRQKFQEMRATEIVVSMIFEPQLWQNVRFVELNHKELRRDLELDPGQKYVSPEELGRSPRLMPLFGELQAKEQVQEKLTPYFQAVQRLGNQMSFINELVAGRSLRFVPPTAEEGRKTSAWISMDQAPDEFKLRFTLIGATWVNADPATHARVPEHAGKFQELARSRNAAVYPSASALDREVKFNRSHPFRWAWIAALLSAILLSFAVFSPAPWLYASGMGLFLLSFVTQIYGFVMRCLIAGRPPVTNMYESVIWVAFGCMLFGAILEWFYRKRVIAIGALAFAIVALIIVDNASGVVDDSIHPLEPVLRSNLWLTVHVLTITLGYSAFALSLVLGNIGLSQWALFGKESSRLPVSQLAFFAYRAVQVGVLLLAAGTILGGVWADYSWGRFWGWDPKETWALIALLGYLALIHARYRGMVRPMGFLAGCVAAFLGVLMA